MDVQEEFDEANDRPVKLPSKEKLEALIADARRTSLPGALSDGIGPIESAMQRHPRLTREGAEAFLKAFGY